MTSLKEITEYLNEILSISLFVAEKSNNGLQIQGKQKIEKIVFGVDISQNLISQAIACNADMIFVHHGLSWGNSLKYITDINYNRIRSLIKNDISLYGAHLPLDAHLKFGNNVT